MVLALTEIYFSGEQLHVNVSFMGDIRLRAIISLGGVIVGSNSNLLYPRTSMGHATRRELYGSFAGQCNVRSDRLIDVARFVQENMRRSG